MFASEWLIHQEKDFHFEQPNVEDLAANLHAFYACARSVDGNVYSKSSMPNLRAGLNCVLTSPPYCRHINLMHFSLPIMCLWGWSENWGRVGWTRHKDTIRANDMTKLYECGALSTDNPVGLQRKFTLKCVCISVTVGEMVLGSSERIHLSSNVMTMRESMSPLGIPNLKRITRGSRKCPGCTVKGRGVSVRFWVSRNII